MNIFLEILDVGSTVMWPSQGKFSLWKTALGLLMLAGILLIVAAN